MKIKEILLKYKKTIIVVPMIFVISVALALFINAKIETSYRLQRAILYFAIGCFLYIIRPKSIIHKVKLEEMKLLEKLICLAVAIITIVIAVSPMPLNEVWGQPWGHHNQYEDFTESLMRGHVYFDQYEPPQKLEEVSNPYDLHVRNKAKIDIRWDHAYYQGKYYMYFGVVPVILVFIPLKLIGITITSANATQIFSGFLILGMFMLFYEMAKKLCPKMKIAMYLSVSIVASWTSLWFAVIFPAMYCTSIISGVSLAVWGFYFCFKAFIVDDKKGKVITDAILGALCSALIFGCRPPIGFISFAYIPMIVDFLKKNASKDIKEKVHIAIAFCTPYIIVAICLMAYNYARFENPFEFGARYQLTAEDQGIYGFGYLSIPKIVNGFVRNFIATGDIAENFPWVNYCGVFFNFPMLLFVFYNFSKKKDDDIKGLVPTLFGIVAMIVLFQVAWTPLIITRYSLDFNFILGILMMFAMIKWVNSHEEEKASKHSFVTTIFATITIITCFLLFFIPYDSSLVELQPEIKDRLEKFVLLK